MLTSSTEPTPRMGHLGATRAFGWELLSTMRLAGGRASPLGLRWAMAASHGNPLDATSRRYIPDDVDHM